MQLPAAFGLFRSMRSPTSPLFKALGRPDYVAKIHGVRLAVLALAIYPLTDAYGLPGTSLAVLVTSAIGVPTGAVQAVRLVDDTVRAFAAIVVFPMIGSAVAGACAIAARRAVAEVARGSRPSRPPSPAWSSTRWSRSRSNSASTSG